MIDEKQSAEGMGDEQFKKASGRDLGFAAYVIGASVLLGAILISASVFYSVRQVTRRLEAGAGLAAAQEQAPTVQPAAPAAPGQAQALPAQGAPVKITLPANVPYLGSSNAKVMVVEYADYECPYCEKFFTGTWPDLKTKYVDTGKIKFIYQDFAFLGPDSNTAAEASHCAADQNKFWQYHDYLFTNQGQEGSGWATADHQKQFAQTMGLNTAQFNKCLDSGKYKQEVLNETAAGHTYGVSGTPTIFVNGTPIVGAQPASAFEQAIDAALAAK